MLPGVHRVRATLSGDRVGEYWYAWRGGPRILSLVARSDAYLAAFGKTAGRRFDYAGLPILTDAEWKLVKDARDEEAVADFTRHVSVTMEVARLDWLDGSVK